MYFHLLPDWSVQDSLCGSSGFSCGSTAHELGAIQVGTPSLGSTHRLSASQPTTHPAMTRMFIHIAWPLPSACAFIAYDPTSLHLMGGRSPHPMS